MKHAFEAIKVTDNVYWVGAIDWDLRNFHGYLTSRGTTYNAFLIVADKITLIDTVKADYVDEMLARIASVVEPEKIDLIVSNHAEMDHSGALPHTIAAVKPTTVYASKMGVKALGAHFSGIEAETVTDGQVLDLGNLKLSCVTTPMCHWPDSMVSYLHEDEILFSQDAFGMHLASKERFADELSREILDYEAGKYFANILLHLPQHISRALDKLTGLGIPVTTLAPDHGPIWRTADDIEHIIGAYGRWAAQRPTNKAVVVYDTMWQSTAAMARAIGDGLATGGADVRLMSTASHHRSDVITELLDAGALVVGAPTMNNNVFPAIADVMTYLAGLKPRNLVGAAFGSYGWSGEAPKLIHAMLDEMGVNLVADPLRINYVPDGGALATCHELGLTIAAATRAAADADAQESVE